MTTPPAEVRDRLGAALGFRRDPGTGTWWGDCPACGAPRASVALTGLSCGAEGAEGCGALSLERAKAIHLSDPACAFPLLADLLERPELLAPPEPVVPRLAWRGRTTGLIGADKSGKSTIAAHAVVELSRGGWWLGERVAPGRAVVAAPDEAPGDTVRRLHELGADPERVRVLVLRPPDLLGALDKLLSEHPADLVVVDSLSEWGRLSAGQAPDDGDASGWGAIVRPLVALSRVHAVAILLLHHPRRSDGQYRGSGEIAAALDALIEMRTSNPGEDPSLRRLTGRARWPAEDYSIRLEDGRFMLGGGGALSLDALVLCHVEANPGTSKTKIRHAVQGRATAIDAAANRLLERGAIVNRGTNDRPSYFVPGLTLDMGEEAT